MSEMPSDKQLKKDVQDELEFEPSVNAANVGVAVTDGVVTLTGHVSAYAQKLAAERAARRVKGVRAIAQEIEVRFASDAKISDEDVAKRAVSVLSWNTILPAQAVRVTVHEGWVTLSGEVDWQYQKIAAEEAVRPLPGVAAVINNLSIKPHVLVKEVKQKIENALKRNAEIEANGIRVSVRDEGTVAIEGKVRDSNERNAVKNAVWSAQGVRFIEDDLTIG
jgi:osmotically-inducible protein OsmY